MDILIQHLSIKSMKDGTTNLMYLNSQLFTDEFSDEFSHY